MEKPIRIFSPVWGTKHISLFENALCKSLGWNKNREVIQNVSWIILTDNKETLKECAKIARVIAPYAEVEGLISEQLSNSSERDLGAILLNGVKSVIKMCLSDGHPMLIATPDFIFSDGTIASFVQAGDQPGTCVSIPNMRVLHEIMSGITSNPLNSAQLVSLGLKHAHVSWTKSERGSDQGMSYGGGISWFNLNEKVIAVRHRLPSPFYVNFLKEDLDFFESKENAHPNNFMLWDHAWPTELIRRERIRYIGSSDGALMIEVTEKDANVPNINPQNKTNNGEYFRHMIHNQVQGQFLYTMRKDA